MALFKVEKTHKIKKDKESMQKFISKEQAILIPLEDIELTFGWVADQFNIWDAAIDVQEDVIIIHELISMY